MASPANPTSDNQGQGISRSRMSPNGMFWASTMLWVMEG